MKRYTASLAGRGQGSFSGSLQVEVGRQTSIMVSTADGTVRLSNSEPMNPYGDDLAVAAPEPSTAAVPVEASAKGVAEPG